MTTVIYPLMQWSLDATFSEDACSIRIDDREEAFSRSRKSVSTY